MPRLDLSKDLLHDWVMEETRPLDVVASWESLCDTYRMLEFHDDMSDATKLEEFKWIIKEMNKFLSRMRSKLMGSDGVDAMMECLGSSFVPTGKVNIDGRRSLAFQKLRQRWIAQMMAKAKEIAEMEGADGGYVPDGE